jgi:bacterial/archaeal transporter family-2 protein
VNRMFLLWSAWTILAGIGIPLVGVLNGGMARSVGNPISAAAVMFAVAFAAVALLAVSFFDLPSIAQLRSAPLSGYGSGLFIAFYAVSATIIIPRFGAGNFVAFILLAQLLMSAILDQFGLFGLPVRPIDIMRAVAFLLIAIGIIVMQFATSKAPE